MGIKIICIDLDGTLFNGRKIKRISSGDRKAVCDAYKKGVQVVITTGRLFNNAAAVSRSLNIKCPVISSNGSIIGDEELNTIYYKNIPYEECMKINKLLNKYNLTAHFYTKDKVIPNNLKASLMGKIYKYRNLNRSFKIDVKSIYSNEKLEKNIYTYKDEIVKCVVYSLNSINIKKFKEELKSDKRITICGDGRHSAEITAENVSKGEGVKFLSSYLNIDREEILCIGDNENDISMLENCGTFAAMENGVEILKEKADYVTDTNKNCGVAKAMYKFLH